MAHNVAVALLAKARSIGGPLLTAAFLGAAAGVAWQSLTTDREQLRADVVRLDSTTVKRSEFERVVADLTREMRANGSKTDSTNALLRRLICRDSPRLCP